MRVKLLKKIRKQYSIVYYPNGLRYGKCVWHTREYVVMKKGRSMLETKGYVTRERAIEAILEEVRTEYSGKFKRGYYRGVKVWHV